MAVSSGFDGFNPRRMTQPVYVFSNFQRDIEQGMMGLCGMQEAVSGRAEAPAVEFPVIRSLSFVLLERDDFSSNRHPAQSFCLSMISAQTRSAFVG